MNPCAIKVEHARRTTALSTGALVFHFVTKIDANAKPARAKTQADLDVRLALRIPRIKAADGAECFEIDERTTGMHCLRLDNSATWRRFHADTVKFFPEREDL